MEPEILVDAEMDAFATAYLDAQDQAAGSAMKWEKLHAELYRYVEPAVARFAGLLADDPDAAEAFRAVLNDYTRKYSFLSQIVSYGGDEELERLHLFGRHLLNRLPRGADGGVDIGETDLSHLRVEKTGEHDVGLTPDGPALLPGFGDGTGGAGDDEKSLLSDLIAKFNDRYGTTFTEQDVITPFEEAVADPKVRLAAVANTEDNFGVVFDDVFEDKMADHVDTIADMGRQYFGPDKSFRSTLNRSARNAAWRLIRNQENVSDDVA